MKKWTSSAAMFALCAIPGVMPTLLLASGGAEHAEAPHGPPSFVWFHLINFVILAGFLFTKLRRPIFDHVLRRSDGIRDQLERADNARKEAEARAAELEVRLAGLTAELDTMIKQAEADAQLESQRLIANSEATAVRMKADAERLLKEEVTRARVQMRQEVITLAVELAERLLTEKITQTDQRRLADDYLRQMSQSKEMH